MTEEIRTMQNVNGPWNFQISSFENNLGKNTTTKVKYDLQGKIEANIQG